MILSSLDSLLNAGAVVFTQDVVKPLTGISDRDVADLRTSGDRRDRGPGGDRRRRPCPSVIKGLLVCYRIWAPAILPAAVIGLWMKRPRPLARILSMVTGATAAIGLQIVALRMAPRAGSPPDPPGVGRVARRVPARTHSRRLSGAQVMEIVTLIVAVLATVLVMASGVWVTVVLIAAVARVKPSPAIRKESRPADETAP